MSCHENMFSLVIRCYSYFNLEHLETIYIKYLQPSLCKQNELPLALNQNYLGYVLYVVSYEYVVYPVFINEFFIF